jgi:alcohol dehydrogenase
MNPDSAPSKTLALAEFEYQPRTRIIFGLGAIEQLGERACELGIKRVLVVTDAGLVKAGHADRVRDILEAAGLQPHVFDQVRENPTTRDVDACVAAAKACGVELLVGLGGGSAMDTAKGCNFLLTNGGRMQDYWGVGKASQPMLPLIAIPTTAGTGSECQSAALIVDEQTHQKMACLDTKAAARIALLDPALTLSQPPRVTAYTGTDAVAHALETAVTTRRSSLSLMFSQEAFKLTVTALPQVLADPKNVEARGQMLLGAALAGTAIENSMLGAAHAAANPLTAHYGIVHGEAVGVMLPAVVRFNAHHAEAREAYDDLSRSLNYSAAGCGDGVDALVQQLQRLLNAAQIARSLADLEIPAKDIPVLAREATAQWTARFNPRPVSAAEFEQIYAAALQA